jgi:hypothetical protein
VGEYVLRKHYRGVPASVRVPVQPQARGLGGVQLVVSDAHTDLEIVVWFRGAVRAAETVSSC